MSPSIGNAIALRSPRSIRGAANAGDANADIGLVVLVVSDGVDTADTCGTAPGWHPNPKPWRTEIDDEGLRPDWRDAEFGGPFPDTIDLKVLVTTVRGRIERVRDIITAPRPALTQEDNRDHGISGDEAAARWDVTDPPAEDQRVDPDEPPF